MRRAVMAFVAVALTAGGTHAGAVPPIVGGALASDNVDYIATIPDVPAIGGKIIDDTLYVTTLQGVRIYDVSLGPPVLIGAIEYPHWQNEWVDTNGEILLVSADNVVGVRSTLSIFDVSIPHAPVLKSVTEIQNGHTASCIADCSYVWTTGDDILDIRDPANPVPMGTLGWNNRHHVDVDDAGYAYMDGYRVVDTNGYSGDRFPPTVATARYGGYGWHGSLRPQALLPSEADLADDDIDPGETVIGTTEHLQFLWSQELCTYDGPFHTSWFHKLPSGQMVVDLLDSWNIGAGTVEGSKDTLAMCSSHWFDWHDGIVANAWYEQGIRFLDVSNPREIRQIGYFMPAVTEAWGARFNLVEDGPLPGLYVYTFDVARGIDVLMFNGEAGDATVLAPHMNPVRTAVQPSPEYGYACRLSPVGLAG